MKKVRAEGFCGVFLNPKSMLAVILLAAIICILSCIAAVGYANADSQMALLSTAVIKAAEAVSQSGEWQTVQMRVTAYCPCQKCCGKYSDGITACGHKIRPGDAFIAADKKYPFGTEMSIVGYKNAKPVKVLDRGGAICGNRLDVFFESHEQALKWGVKYLDVKVRRQAPRRK